MDKVIVETSNTKSIVINKKILNYISENLKKGYTEEQIKTSMLNSGYSADFINTHFNFKRKQKTYLYFGIIIFFILLLSSILFLIYNKGDIGKKFYSLIAEGNILCEKRDYEKAMEKYERAIKLNSSSSRGYGSKAECLLKQEKYQEAVVEIKKAIHLSETYQPGYFNLNSSIKIGNAFCEVGEFKRGIFQLKRAISKNQSNELLYNTLAACYMKMGDNESTAKYLNISEHLE